MKIPSSVRSPSSLEEHPVVDSGTQGLPAQPRRSPSRHPVQGLLVELAQLSSSARPSGSQVPHTQALRAVRPCVGDSPAAGQSGLVRLPDELHEEIGSRLDAPNRERYALAHPAIGRALRQSLLADQFVFRAADVRSLGQMDQLVAAIISLSTPSGRPAAMAALGQRIGFLPSVDRANGFASLLEAVETLDPLLRGAPLAALAERIGALPGAERPQAIAQLLNGHRNLPAQDRATLLRALGGEVRFVPEPHQESMLNSVLDAAASLPPRQHSTVVASIANFAQNNTPNAHWAYQRLLSLTERMEPQHRGAALAALGSVIEHLPQRDQNRVFAQVLRMTLEMPAAARSDALAGLASQIHCVAQPERRTTFARLRGAIAALPPERRAKPATRLAEKLDWLDMDDRNDEFHCVLELAHEMPGDGHAQTLAALANRVGTLGHATGAALGNLLARLERLPQQAQTEPLTVLRDHVQLWRRPEDRGPALQAVANAIAQLAPQHRPEALSDRPPVRRFRW